MWEFLLPLLISAISGGIGSAISANQTELQNRRQAVGAEAQRHSLQQVVDELKNPNYGNVDAQFMLDLGRTLGQLRATDAQRGTTASGRSDTAQRNAITKGLAQLGQFKAQDLTNRENEIARILGSPAFGAPNPNSFDPGSAALYGLFGGTLAGAGSALTAFLGSQGGVDILKNALGIKGAPTASTEALGAAPYNNAILPTIDWKDAFATPTFNNPYLSGGNFSDFAGAGGG